VITKLASQVDIMQNSKWSAVIGQLLKAYLPSNASFISLNNQFGLGARRSLSKSICTHAGHELENAISV
jgi:hypothetical protein